MWQNSFCRWSWKLSRTTANQKSIKNLTKMVENISIRELNRHKVALLSKNVNFAITPITIATKDYFQRRVDLPQEVSKEFWIETSMIPSIKNKVLKYLNICVSLYSCEYSDPNSR